MTDHYQFIARTALSACDGNASTLLLYAEVEDGCISADIFFQLRGENVVRFRFAPEALQELVYRFWESGAEKIAPKSWAALKFVVREGKFSADLTYPDQMNPDEGLSDRRPLAVAECFPGLKVDYSKPNGEPSTYP